MDRSRDRASAARRAPRTRGVLLAALAAILLATLAPTPTAQTLVGLDGGAATALEVIGPPRSCNLPTWPVLAGLPYAGGAFACLAPGPVPFAPPFIGGVTTSRVADTYWVTDGKDAFEMTASGATAGTIVNEIPAIGAPFGMGPLNGIALDSAGATLWITDRFVVGGVFLPTLPCAAPVPSFPGFPTCAPAALTDISWDPATGTLWGCDLSGAVTNFLPGGALGPGGSFPAATVGCGFVPATPLTGIAVDTATPLASPTVLVVTDGFVVAYINPPAVPVSPGFYAQYPCYSSLTPPFSAIETTLRPIAYGNGTDPAGLTPPVLSGTNQTVPGATVGFLLSGADPTPGTVAGVLYGVTPACIPLLGLGGNLIWLFPVGAPVGPFPVVGGWLSLTFTRPAGAPIGATLFMQCIVVKGSGGCRRAMGCRLRWGCRNHPAAHLWARQRPPAAAAG